MPPKGPGKSGFNTGYKKAGASAGTSQHYKPNNDIFAFNAGLNAVNKMEQVKKTDQIDSMMGFERFEGGSPRTGWLLNMHATLIPGKDYIAGVAAVDYYFLDQDGGSFKATIQLDPYFFVCCTPGFEGDVEEYLKKKLESSVKYVARVSKEDLSIPNHLIGIKRALLKLSFPNQNDLTEAKRFLQPIVKDNESKRKTKEIYSAVNTNYNNNNNNGDLSTTNAGTADVSEYIEDIREHDVPYCTRVSIDRNLRVGKWYKVSAEHTEINCEEIPDRIDFGDTTIMAFDIETTKRPLKFPDSATDQVMMISYMIDGDGFLITNREIISEDIEDFEYTPKKEYPGLFAVFNETDEKATLERFFEHIREAKPQIIATFNGDFFDWPFVEARAAVHGLNMYDEIGFAPDSEGEYKSTYCSHMDCYRWVKRDSYLPQGSQGLKAVTTAKLGYNPIELDPELMTPYAYSKPQLLSEYSVSDAVATYYLFKKIVNNFIVSLGIILPLNPDELLRKGTGTLCEMLLMVQAYANNILLPNKHQDPPERFYDGHLLESETYVGGHVESLEAGVFRSDIDADFKIDPTVIDELLIDLKGALEFSIVVEGKAKLEDVTNFDEIYEQVKTQLLDLKENPKRREKPLIYHVDVASMYPNIMCSNRLQPDSMKTEKDCAACDFNRPGMNCDRRMTWAWRGEFYPAKMDEYQLVKRSLQNETFPPRFPGQPRRAFDDLAYDQQVTHIKKRLQDYSRKVYHKVKQTETIKRESIVCQRENPFYVNTVRDFRDQRYNFKGLAKVWKKKASGQSADEKDESLKRAVYYDSLQLAYKVILNSFYGYVMRKGSRWYSIEMAGITCLTGATIIQMARALIERLGRPLELDTDGIWCIIPSSFPDNFTFELKNGKNVFLSYPCSMVNYLVHERFTNHQYQTLVDPVVKKYATHSDNSIFFEVDGPYKAMILPTSKEEGKGLKKRYAVFNVDGTLAELKGFELKRRGELQLIKNFQSDIFKLFLEGDSLESCYAAVASVANRWLDVLDTKGSNLEDDDLFELICENKSMSKSLDEYEGQKSTSITTAKRLGEFLGAEMVKDKGLAVKYIISEKPKNAPVTERAVPVAIFSSELSVKRSYLRRWLLDPSLDDFDPRSIIDWNYYRERLESVVQKIITIPAALQDVENPVPRVAHPEWLQKRIATKLDKKKQSSLSTFFGKTTANPIDVVKDMEDIGKDPSYRKPLVGKVTSKKRKGLHKETEEPSEEEVNMLNGPCPSMDDDYTGFLVYQKLKWKVQQKARERRKKLFGETADTGGRSTVGSMVRNQAENFVGSTWEVIQYKLDNSAGDVRAFVLIDGKIQSFVFHVPRTLYLNLRSSAIPNNSIPSCEIEKVNSVLPNGVKASNLFRLSMPESVYQAELNKAGSLLHHPSVNGVFESHVEPTERVIMELGNSVMFNSSKLGALGKSLENGFDLKSLAVSDTSHYLSRFSMESSYLFHMVTNEYQIFSLFNSWSNKANIFVLKPTRSAQPLTGNFEKVYRELRQLKKDKLTEFRGIIDYKDDMEFELHHFEDLGKLYRRVNSFINKINEETPTKPMFVLQSPAAKKLTKILKNLNDFPIINMNVNEVQLPAIGWQSIVIKRVCNHFLSLAPWINHLKNLAKYGKIPLCNLKTDDIGYLIDIEYARRLKKSDIVLWWSSKPAPDYGGAEKDVLMIESESFEFPVINNPEIYETTAIEVEIDNLTINTVLTSALLNEAEGTDMADVETIEAQMKGESTILAEDSFSGPSLNVLRSMLKDWWDDAMKNDPNADSMVHTFVSWVQKRESFLFDSYLKYHVHNLTKKALLQLAGEFSKLGATVIFANRSKMMLKTTKQSVESSYAYAQYIVKAVRSRPLFNFLDLRIEKYWDLLVWMNQYNYAGRACIEISDTEEQELVGISKWQIKQYLPRIYQPEFDDWLVIFLDSLIKKKTEDATNVEGTPRITQIHQILKMQGSTKQPEEDIENGVTSLFRKPLLKRIKQLLRNQTESIFDEDMKADYEFPHPPGFHLNPKNPLLEFIKFLTAVFALSSERELEMRMLKKEMLDILEVKEFSAEGRFMDPSATLVMPAVLCEYCHQTRDLDFCRDDEKTLWSCDNCEKKYNKAHLELMLVESLEKLVTNYYIQDVRCSKCKKGRGDDMTAYCSCSGSWVATLTKNEVADKVSVFDQISDYYELNLLKDHIEAVF